MEEKSFRTENGFLLAQSDGCSVYQFRNDTGDGTMTCYEVFPGAMLSFNDFHVAHFDSAYVPGRNMFVIDHCREGKMEILPRTLSPCPPRDGSCGAYFRRAVPGAGKNQDSLFQN